MKKIILAVFFIIFSITPVKAALARETEIQNKIDNIGTSILNSNKIQTHVIFTYNSKTRKIAMSSVKGLSKHQVILYDGAYQHTDNDDEIAAFLSREIYIIDRVNDRFLNRLNLMKDKKFYELIIDKKAVDYMVNSGYNPMALITFLNKTNPDIKFSLRHNPTNKRLLNIYEYILMKYPQYNSEDNLYLDNPYYQNFLLNTTTERKLLHRDILKRSGIKVKELKYEEI